MFWGPNWQGIRAKTEHLKIGAPVDILIGCVDTRKARRAINRLALRSRGIERFNEIHNYFNDLRE
jgi:hypothetical protein